MTRALRGRHRSNLPNQSAWHDLNLSDVCLCEILTGVEQSEPINLATGVGKTIADIELRRRVDALAVIACCFNGEPADLIRYKDLTNRQIL